MGSRMHELRNVYSAISRIAHEYNHICDPLIDVQIALQRETDTLTVRCSKCGECWWYDVGPLRAQDIVKMFADEIEARGNCRGKPLYQRIDGTPWFKYNINA